MTTTSSWLEHATPLMIGPPTKTRLAGGLNRWKEASTIISGSLSSSQRPGTTQWNSPFSTTTCTGTTILGTTTLSQAGCCEDCRLHKILDCHGLNFPLPLPCMHICTNCQSQIKIVIRYARACMRASPAPVTRRMRGTLPETVINFSDFCMHQLKTITRRSPL